MKKFFVLITLLLSASVMSAGIYEIHLITKPRKGADRTELPAEPQANYDDENNTVEVAIDASQLIIVQISFPSAKAFSMNLVDLTAPSS